MTNILKIGFLSLLVPALLFIGFNSANAAALTFNTDYIVDLSSPDVNLTIVSGSEATSLVVNTGSINVVVPDGDTFTVTSADTTLTVTGTTSATVTSTCVDLNTRNVAILGGVSGETLTVTASGTSCDSGTSGGGGGGGGSRSNNNDDDEDDTPTPTTPTTPTPSSSSTLSGLLKVGSIGSNVMTLQTKLGIMADGQFGPMTKKAVMDFQTANGLMADGVVGAMTWAKVMGSTAVTPTVTPSSSSTLSGLLKVGSIGSNVMTLQTKLGIMADGQFGPMTKKAVMDFQTANGLMADGVVGAMTWAVVTK